MAKRYPDRRRPLLVLLAAALSLPDGALALHPPSCRTFSSPVAPSIFSRSILRRRGATAPTGVSSSDNDSPSTEEGGMTALRFRGSTSYTTEEIPRSSSSGKSVMDFFATEEYRNILLTGSGNVVHPLGPDGMTPDILDRWTSEAERVGSAPPRSGGLDAAVKVTTTGIQFPGLKLLSVATIGPRLLLPDDAGTGGASPDPEYEFTLIADEIKVEGPRPLKWVFKRLTEFGRSKDGSAKEQTTHSLTRVRVKPAEGDPNGVVFCANAYLEVEVKFPAFLLKILPTSKEKAEEQGSMSMQKTVEKDLGPSMERFREAYLKYLES